MKQVLIIEPQVKRYRVPFFRRLHSVLHEAGVRLKVAYSDPPAWAAVTSGNANLPPEIGVKVKALWFPGRKLVFQPLFRHVATADLVITDAGNRYVINHLLRVLSKLKLKKVAFWGHGKNRQADRPGVSEWYKRRTLNWVDWWFAYTDGCANYLARQGVPRGKITAVQNSIDTRELREQIARITDETVLARKHKLGVPADALVGIFCGTMNPVKSMDVLIASSERIKSRLPGFHLLIVGEGYESGLVENAVSHHRDWIHWVGPKFEAEKALFLKVSDVLLMPGAVGLVILDAFAAGIPLLTTKLTTHGPEIEYLEDGANGLIAENNPEAYARAVVAILSDPGRLRSMKLAASKSAERYSIETMVERFRDGIARCLKLNLPAASFVESELRARQREDEIRI